MKGRDSQGYQLYFLIRWITIFEHVKQIKLKFWWCVYDTFVQVCVTIYSGIASWEYAKGHLFLHFTATLLPPETTNASKAWKNFFIMLSGPSGYFWDYERDICKRKNWPHLNLFSISPLIAVVSFHSNNQARCVTDFINILQSCWVSLQLSAVIHISKAWSTASTWLMCQNHFSWLQLIFRPHQSPFLLLETETQKRLTFLRPYVDCKIIRYKSLGHSCKLERFLPKN